MNVNSFSVAPPAPEIIVEPVLPIAPTPVWVWAMIGMGAALVIAVIVLTYMIFWMDRNSRSLKGELQEKIDTAITERQVYSLVSLVFFSVFREGLETVLFLTGVRFATESLQETILGGALGLLAASLLGYVIIRGSIELNFRKFFRITGLVLLIFAAGLFAFGVHELIEAGWLPPGLGGDRIFDISHILSDKSVVGSLLRALVGYNDNPFFWEAMAYVFFWFVIGLTLIWLNRRESLSQIPSYGKELVQNSIE